MANLIFQKEKKTFWSFLFGTKITFSFYDDGMMVYNYNRPKFWIFKTNKTVEVHAKDLQFFVPGNGFLGIPGTLFNKHSVYLGGPNGQFTVEGLKNKEVLELREHICNFDSPISESGSRCSCWNIWNPISWFRKEYLYTTPSGVRYECGKNMAFIPWEDIKFFYDYTTLFTFGWDVFLYGKHFIRPKARVHGDFVREVKSHLKNDAEDGKKLNVRPGMLSRIFNPLKSKKPVVIMTDKAIFSIDSNVVVLNYDNIEDYELVKEHWYSFRGTATIRGYVGSIRKDQGTDCLTIEKENINRCMWRKVKNMISENQ